MFGDKKMLRQHQKKTKYCIKIQLEAKEVCNALLIETNKELTCQFCGNEFSTKYLLNKHQTQAKYCLKIQESQKSEVIVKSFITCTFCNKNFSSSTFNRHDSTCKKKNQFLLDKKDQENVKKDLEIAILKIKAENAEEIAKMKAEIGSIYKESAERAQATIEEIAKQPTYQKNSTRNIQNNLMISNLTPLDLSQARVDSIIDERYTKNDFYEGQKGAAHLVHKYIATDSEGNPQIVCTDTERGIFHHKSSVGDHVVDYKNVHLIKKVHSPLKRKAGEFAAEESVKNPTALKEIINNMTSIKDLETKPCNLRERIAQNK
jgi:chloramphenicol O-acetyltransferase